MLHKRRKALEEIARREGEGESFWTTEFSPEVRRRLVAVFELLAPGHYSATDRASEGIIYALRSELGVDVAAWPGSAPEAVGHALATLSNDDAPSVIEAIHAGLRHAFEPQGQAIWETAVNAILNEHRISFEMINGEMIERESQELHAEVVAPTLRLLSGRPGWDKVESAYQDALREISQNNPGDAITDAGTALQEALKLLGCDGNSLGLLAKSARSKGILAPHDATLNDAVQKIIDWVSADRSETGDAHKASTATRDDAWLAVHVVGALLLRLAGNPRTAS